MATTATTDTGVPHSVANASTTSCCGSLPPEPEGPYHGRGSSRPSDLSASMPAPAPRSLSAAFADLSTRPRDPPSGPSSGRREAPVTPRPMERFMGPQRAHGAPGRVAQLLSEREPSQAASVKAAHHLPGSSSSSSDGSFFGDPGAPAHSPGCSPGCSPRPYGPKPWSPAPWLEGADAVKITRGLAGRFAPIAITWAVYYACQATIITLVQAANTPTPGSATRDHGLLTWAIPGAHSHAVDPGAARGIAVAFAAYNAVGQLCVWGVAGALDQLAAQVNAKDFDAETAAEVAACRCGTSDEATEGTGLVVHEAGCGYGTEGTEDRRASGAEQQRARELGSLLVRAVIISAASAVPATWIMWRLFAHLAAQAVPGDTDHRGLPVVRSAMGPIVLGDALEAWAVLAPAACGAAGLQCLQRLLYAVGAGRCCLVGIAWGVVALIVGGTWLELSGGSPAVAWDHVAGKGTAAWPAPSAAAGALLYAAVTVVSAAATWATAVQRRIPPFTGQARSLWLLTTWGSGWRSVLGWRAVASYYRKAMPNLMSASTEWWAGLIALVFVLGGGNKLGRKDPDAAAEAEDTGVAFAVQAALGSACYALPYAMALALAMGVAAALVRRDGATARATGAIGAMITVALAFAAAAMAFMLSDSVGTLFTADRAARRALRSARACFTGAVLAASLHAAVMAPYAGGGIRGQGTALAAAAAWLVFVPAVAVAAIALGWGAAGAYVGLGLGLAVEGVWAVAALSRCNWYLAATDAVERRKARRRAAFRDF